MCYLFLTHELNNIFLKQIWKQIASSFMLKVYVVKLISILFLYLDLYVED